MCVVFAFFGCAHAREDNLCYPVIVQLDNVTATVHEEPNEHLFETGIYRDLDFAVVLCDVCVLVPVYETRAEGLARYFRRGNAQREVRNQGVVVCTFFGDGRNLERLRFFFTQEFFAMHLPGYPLFLTVFHYLTDSGDVLLEKALVGSLRFAQTFEQFQAVQTTLLQRRILVPTEEGTAYRTELEGGVLRRPEFVASGHVMVSVGCLCEHEVAGGTRAHY